MVYFLPAPSHYLNQCWHVINGFLFHSPGGFHKKCSRCLSIHRISVSCFSFQIIATSSGDRCTKHNHAQNIPEHYNDVIMGAMTSQITSLTIVYSTVNSGADQRKNQSYASLAFVQGIHRWPVNSPHKGPVTRKMFPFDDVIRNEVDILSTKQSGTFLI